MKTQLTADGNYILSPFRRWFGLFLMALGGGTIYLVPYLLYQYIGDLTGVNGLTQDQLGSLMTVYGIINIIFYIPGGWVADRFSTKTLFTFSMIATGGLSIWYSLLGFGFVDFTQLVLIHALFAVSTVLTFWSAFVKGVNLFSKKGEEAKTYSRTDLMRNIIGVLCGFISVGLSSIAITGTVFIDGGSQMFFTIGFYGAIYIITGVLCAFIMPGEWIQKSTKRNFDGLWEFTASGTTEVIVVKDKKDLRPYKNLAIRSFWVKVGTDLIQSLKNANMWLIALLVFFIMNTYAAINSFGTYFMADYGMTNSQVITFLSYTFQYGAPILGALFFGWWTNNKTKCASKSIIHSNIALIAVCAIILVVSGTNQTSIETGKETLLPLIIGIVMFCVGMFFVGGSRAIYWSTMNETKIPLSIMGISSGLISIIGFSKDVYVFPLFTGDSLFGVSGIWSQYAIHGIVNGKDAILGYTNDAYVALYTYALINAVCALLISYVIFQRTKNGKFWSIPQSFKYIFSLNEQFNQSNELYKKIKKTNEKNINNVNLRIIAEISSNNVLSKNDIQSRLGFNIDRNLNYLLQNDFVISKVKNGEYFYSINVNKFSDKEVFVKKGV